MKHFIFGLFFLFFVTAFPSTSHAQVAFGGLVIADIPCTCSPFQYEIFAPLFINSPIPFPTLAGLSIPDPPFVLAFPFYYPIPSEWMLGEMIPTAGAAPACWMFVGWGCLPLESLTVPTIPELGVITPYSGTSL
jgi:hypothetical protein